MCLDPEDWGKEVLEEQHRRQDQQKVKELETKGATKRRVAAC